MWDKASVASAVREGCPVAPRGSQMVRRRDLGGVLGKSILGKGSSKGEKMRQE